MIATIIVLSIAVGALLLFGGKKTVTATLVIPGVLIAGGSWLYFSGNSGITGIRNDQAACKTFYKVENNADTASYQASESGLNNAANEAATQALRSDLAAAVASFSPAALIHSQNVASSTQELLNASNDCVRLGYRNPDGS